MKILIEQPVADELDRRGVFSWPVWEKEASRFDWFYDATEECYLLEGEVSVETPDGNRYEFGRGDYVTFPKGLSCTWDIRQAVKKHYTFK